MSFTIRPAVPQDAAAIARVRVETWRSAYRGIVPDSTLENLDAAADTQRLRERLSTNPAIFTLCAEDETGQVIGFATGGPNRAEPLDYPGEVYAIYILDACQQQGLGRRLIRASFEELSARGLFPAVIWALEANSACAFYRRIGGVQVGRKPIEIGGVSLPEIGFGFSDPDVWP